jgi:MurNAc alpha-1-phosphate uridylyltransferase
MAQLISAFNGLWERVHGMLEVGRGAGRRRTGRGCVVKAMILAAGRGKRMGALTRRVPKPLLCLGRETLIERHLRRLAAAGVRDVVVNLSYRGDAIRAKLGNGSRWGVVIHYSPEGEPPLETGGGVIAALPWLGERPFLLVNADIVTDFDFGRLQGSADAGTLVLVANPPHHPRGDFGLAASGRVTATPPQLTFAGISVLSPTLFDGLAPGPRPLKPVLDAAIDAGRLQGVRHDGLWIDVGTPQRLRRAREWLATGGEPRPSDA